MTHDDIAATFNQKRSALRQGSEYKSEWFFDKDRAERQDGKRVMPHPLILDARHASRWRGGTRRASPMWRPPGAILCCCHTPGCGALRAPHPGLRMVRPSGPNLADQATCFVRFGPKTTIIQYSCFCAVGAPKSPRGPQAVPGVQGVIPRGPIRPHGPIHGIMPHESVSPRPSTPRQLVPTVLGVPWNRQYQWVRHYGKRNRSLLHSQAERWTFPA